MWKTSEQYNFSVEQREAAMMDRYGEIEYGKHK